MELEIDGNMNIETCLWRVVLLNTNRTNHKFLHDQTNFKKLPNEKGEEKGN